MSAPTWDPATGVGSINAPGILVGPVPNQTHEEWKERLGRVLDWGHRNQCRPTIRVAQAAMRVHAGMRPQGGQ